MTIDEAIRELRAHLGLTQEAFAREIGATLKTISRYENGGRPSRLYLQRLMSAAPRDRRDLHLVFKQYYKNEIDDALKGLPSAGTARRMAVWELREIFDLLLNARNDFAHLSSFIPAEESKTKIRIKKDLAEILDRIRPWLKEE